VKKMWTPQLPESKHATVLSAIYWVICVTIFESSGFLVVAYFVLEILVALLKIEVICRITNIDATLQLSGRSSAPLRHATKKVSMIDEHRSFCAEQYISSARPDNNMFSVMQKNREIDLHRHTQYIRGTGASPRNN
jgi:hypothetical protein